MDITKELTVVEWFTGYGGNELGLKRVLPALRPIAFCERESFVVANLVSKMEAGLMDPVPVWSDATTFPAEPFKDRVGLFIASYPCQPFSHAGKRDGQNDERHLWPACRRFVRGVRPRLVFFENVEGHVTLGLSTVLADLEEDGYTAAWGIFSASEVGAPHQRKRVFILAADRTMANSHDQYGYRTQPGSGAASNRISEEHREEQFCDRKLGGADPIDELALRNGLGHPHRELEIVSTERGLDAQRDSAASGGEDVADQQREGLEGGVRDGQKGYGSVEPVLSAGCGQIWPSRPGERQYAWEPPRVVENSNGGGLPKPGVCPEQSGGAEAVSAGEMGRAPSGDGQRGAQREAGYPTQPDENGIVGDAPNRRKSFPSLIRRTFGSKIFGNGGLITWKKP